MHHMVVWHMSWLSLNSYTVAGLYNYDIKENITEAKE